MRQGINVSYSNGYGKNGKVHVYVRPEKECRNKSRKVSGLYKEIIAGKLDKLIDKWYNPMKYYLVDGHVIGSNSEKNALTEYWRLVERSDIGKIFPVKEIPEPINKFD
jgi:hypothetical protein